MHFAEEFLRNSCFLLFEGVWPASSPLLSLQPIVGTATHLRKKQITAHVAATSFFSKKNRAWAHARTRTWRGAEAYV